MPVASGRPRSSPALDPLADGYGVGTAIANAPVLNFALDIMEIEPTGLRALIQSARELLSPLRLSPG